VSGEAEPDETRRSRLERLVAKPLGSLYKPGERDWLKVKNKAYWKYAIERERWPSDERERRRSVQSERP